MAIIVALQRHVVKVIFPSESHRSALVAILGSQKMKYCNRNLASWGLVLSLLLFGSGGVVSASEAFGDCQAPDAPSLPTRFDSDFDANIWTETAQGYIGESASYLRCLSEYADARRRDLGDAGIQRLRAEHDRSKQQLASFIESWNQLMSREMTRAPQRFQHRRQGSDETGNE